MRFPAHFRPPCPKKVTCSPNDCKVLNIYLVPRDQTGFSLTLSLWRSTRRRTSPRAALIKIHRYWLDRIRLAVDPIFLFSLEGRLLPGNSLRSRASRLIPISKLWECTLNHQRRDFPTGGDPSVVSSVHRSTYTSVVLFLRVPFFLDVFTVTFKLLYFPFPSRGSVTVWYSSCCPCALAVDPFYLWSSNSRAEVFLDGQHCSTPSYPTSTFSIAIRRIRAFILLVL